MHDRQFLPLDLKLARLGVGAPELRAAVVDCVSGVRRFAPGQAVIDAGETLADIHVVLEGLAVREKLLADGGRQILSFQIAGDLCTAQALVSPTLDYGVSAVTPCLVGMLSQRALTALMAREPSLSLALWRATTADAAVERQWILNLGRRSAAARMAHLFCELQIRLRGAGLASEDAFPCPLTQNDLADALGLSTVHVNRTLQQLRRMGLIVFRSGVLKLIDAQGLHALAGFDDQYLRLEAGGDPLAGRSLSRVDEAEPPARAQAQA